MKQLSTFILSIFLCTAAFCQSKTGLVFTSDIDHFWVAYDSAKTTSDTLKQQQFIQKLYVDKASDGLKEFMRVRNYSASLYVKLINKYPKFWASIRSNTLQVKTQTVAIEKSLQHFKELYPEMHPSKMYFTVGGLRSGGTTIGDMVLVGAEIAAADKNTDASELSDWLRNAFKTQNAGNLVDLNVHEYVHTQQGDIGGTLLGQALGEGCADFIAELVTGIKNSSPYQQYGREHEAELKVKFKQFMLSSAMNEWLYNGGSGTAHPDLGYFMGYRICEAFYKHAADKRLAIKTMIELDYGNMQTALDFLEKSKYYTEPINKDELIKSFEAKQPEIIGTMPSVKDSIDASATTITFKFSAPMGKGYSISRSDYKSIGYPITGITGWADDHLSFTVKLALKPKTVYEFVVTGRSFVSAEGYPLKTFTVHFVTK